MMAMGSLYTCSKQIPIYLLLKVLTNIKAELYFHRSIPFRAHGSLLAPEALFCIVLKITTLNAERKSDNGKY